MSLFGDMFKGFMNGVADDAHDRIEGDALAKVLRMIKEVGWDVDEQNGNRITLFFKGGRLMNQRRLCIGCTEKVVIFFSFSSADLKADEMPPDIPAMLLKRNDDLRFEKWDMDVDEDGDVTLSCGYAIPSKGMKPEFFKNLCMSIVAEVAKFDEGLDDRGLYK